MKWCVSPLTLSLFYPSITREVLSGNFFDCHVFSYPGSWATFSHKRESLHFGNWKLTTIYMLAAKEKNLFSNTSKQGTLTGNLSVPLVYKLWLMKRPINVSPFCKIMRRNRVHSFNVFNSFLVCIL